VNRRYLTLLLAIFPGWLWAECTWPAWQHFAEQYIENGRVVDGSDPRQITTSEGQSYAMFFALLANDQKRFADLHEWTEQHLAKGDLSANLPSWLWGRAQDNSWAVLDANSAADSDTWIAYSLAEAGRLWNNHHYRSQGYFLANHIARQETREVDPIGRVLMPAPEGFVSADALRLNPSYWMPQIISRFAHLYPNSVWPELADALPALLRGSAAKGLSPDWVEWRQGDWQTDPKSGPKGSYDAIRVYLWVGMLHPDAAAVPLQHHFDTMLTLTESRGTVPERVNPVSATARGTGPWGFSAALLPMLSNNNRTALLEAQQQRVTHERKNSDGLGRRDYYNRVLDLFADAWLSGRLRFSANGAVEPAWPAGCL
jgi:endo-1,4-beta-D-glucanase Y